MMLSSVLSRLNRSVKCWSICGPKNWSRGAQITHDPAYVRILNYQKKFKCYYYVLNITLTVIQNRGECCGDQCFVVGGTCPFFSLTVLYYLFS